jgi:hypothetical protein
MVPHRPAGNGPLDDLLTFLFVHRGSISGLNLVKRTLHVHYAVDKRVPYA